MANDILRWLLSFLLEHLGLSLGETPFDLMVSSTKQLFPATFGSTGLYPAIEKLIPIGILLAMIYVSKEMLEKTAIQNIDLEQIIKLFTKFIIGFAIVNNVGYIICGMNTFSNSLYDEIGKMFTDLGDPQDVGKTIFSSLIQNNPLIANGAEGLYYVAGGVYIDMIVLVISELINYILQAAFGIICVFISITRAVKLGYKTVWAPIAVANVVGYSTRNAAVTYIKELLSIFLQLPVAYLGYCVGMSLVTGDGIDLLAKIIIYCATIVWVATSAGISKELFT